MLIYAVWEGDEIVYIGQTTQTLEKRIQGHKDAATYLKQKYPLAKAISEKGIDCFCFRVIDKATTIEELNKKEQYYIQKYETQTNGYNIRRGGDNFLHSDKTKMKISKSQRGDKNHMFGKTGEENPCSIKVINLITGDTYHSVTECAQKEGEDISKVAEVCRGEKAGVNGRVYRYIDSDGYIVHIPNEKMPKTKPVYNKTKNEWYQSYDEASRKLGYSRGYLSKKIKTENPPKNQIVVKGQTLIFL